jgi:hypothetical protein
LLFECRSIKAAFRKQNGLIILEPESETNYRRIVVSIAQDSEILVLGVW